MEIAFVGNAQLIKLCCECRQKLRQKIFVHVAHRRDMPTEQLFILTVNIYDNFGTRANSPLGKQMRHFKILYTILAAKLYPAFQKRKIKSILLTGFYNSHKLHCRTLSSDCSIKRRRKQRSQKHGNTRASRRLYELFNKFPVPLAHHLNAEIISNGVTVKPLRKNKVVFINYSILNTDNNAPLSFCFILNICECYTDRVITGFCVRRDIYRKPQRIRIVSAGAHNVGSLYRIQHIGKKTGLFCYVIIVASFKICRHFRRHMPDPRNTYTVKQL